MEKVLAALEELERAIAQFKVDIEYATRSDQPETIFNAVLKAGAQDVSLSAARVVLSTYGLV